MEKNHFKQYLFLLGILFTSVNCKAAAFIPRAADRNAGAEAPASADECPICLSRSYSSGHGPLEPLQCTHQFHRECLMRAEATAGHDRCPVCQASAAELTAQAEALLAPAEEEDDDDDTFPVSAAALRLSPPPREQRQEQQNAERPQTNPGVSLARPLHDTHQFTYCDDARGWAREYLCHRCWTPYCSYCFPEGHRCSSQVYRQARTATAPTCCQRRQAACTQRHTCCTRCHCCCCR